MKEFYPERNQIDLTGLGERRPRSLVADSLSDGSSVKFILTDALQHHTEENKRLKKQGRKQRNEWLKDNTDRELLEPLFSEETGEYISDIPRSTTVFDEGNNRVKYIVPKPISQVGKPKRGMLKRQGGLRNIFGK